MSSGVFERNDRFKTAALLSCAAVTLAVAAASSRLLRPPRKSKRNVATLGSHDQSADDSVPDRLSWASVAAHNRVDSAWIVLSGEIYDITEWFDDHPGGRFILLAFAGRDATEPFETMGHSAIARRELQKLHVGAVSQQALTHRTFAEAAFSDTRSTALTGGSLQGGQAEAQGEAHDSVWRVDIHGFMPARDPVGLQALKGTAFEAFAEVGELLAAMSAEGSFREYLHADPELQARLRRGGTAQALVGLSADQIERAFGATTFAMLAYLRSGCHLFGDGLGGNDGLPKIAAQVQKDVPLPDYLAEPVMVLSKHLERPPWMDYAACVLYNWTRVDQSGPISTANIRCVHRLTGLLDEEWFFKTHVVIESEAGLAVCAIMKAMEAQKRRDDVELLNQLVVLEEALLRVVRSCLPIMYERDDDGRPRCNEFIFYHILRPLIGSGKINFGQEELVSVNGPSGAMSSLMPCCDAALGIEMKSEVLRKAISSFEKSMPREHRDYLGQCRGEESIREYITKSRPGEADPEHHHEALVRAFNRCISRVLDFRWQHWTYVRNFIMKPGNLTNATGTGGTTFDYLQQHVTDTEMARIAEARDHTSSIDVFAVGSQPLQAPIPSMPPVEPQALWSVDGPHGLLCTEPMWTLADWSLWAEAFPAKLHTAIKALLLLATTMPSLCVSDGPFPSRCEAAKENLLPLNDDYRALASLSEACRERLRTLLSFVAAGCTAVSSQRPPKCIDRPLQVLARSLGRPPQLEFTELVLCNWVSRGDVPGLALRFLGSPEEEWWRQIDFVLHVQARDLVSAMRRGQAAARSHDDRGLVTCFVEITEWLDRFILFLDANFDQKDSRTEAATMHRLKPFVAQDSTADEMACWVYSSGCSVLLPAIHAFVGVSLSSALKPAGRDCELTKTMLQWAEERRSFMPRLHLAFLEELEGPRGSMRRYCLKRFGMQAISVEDLHGLEVAYNDTLNNLARFLSRRAHLVNRLMPEVSTFGALHADVEVGLRKHRLQLLEMRQRSMRCLEKTVYLDKSDKGGSRGA